MPIHHVTVGDARLAVHTSGSGRPLVLLHAFPLDHDMWRRQAELDESLRLIVPDLRGFGGSAGTVPTSIAALADDVAGMLDALHVAEPAVVCGVSMGGYVAQHVAARHPDRVAALVLVDTKLEADSPEARAARTDLAGKVGRVGQAILADAMIRRQRVETIQAALAALGERPDMVEAMQRVGVPTLLIVGAEDQITPPACLEAAEQVIPNARLLIVPHAGHLVPLEAPEVFNHAVLEFLAELSRS